MTLQKKSVSQGSQKKFSNSTYFLRPIIHSQIFTPIKKARYRTFLMSFSIAFPLFLSTKNHYFCFKISISHNFLDALLLQNPIHIHIIQYHILYMIVLNKFLLGKPNGYFLLCLFLISGGMNKVTN